MNNENFDINARIEQIRAEKPWLEEYEIEAIVANESGVDLLADGYSSRRSSKYSAITPDKEGRYGAYSAEAEPDPEPESEPEKPAPSAAERHRVTRPPVRGAVMEQEQEADPEKDAALKRTKKTVLSNIKHESNLIGATLIAYIVFTLALGVFISVFLNVIAGWDINELYTFISNPQNSALIQGGMLFIGLALPFLIYIYIHRLPIGDMIPLHKLRKGEFAPMFFVGLGVLMVSGYIENLISSKFSLTGANFSYNTLSFGTTIGEFLISLLCMTFIPALVETLVFNGIILQVFRRRGGDAFALLFSSALYALLFCNFAEMPGAFFSSVVLGYMVIFSGSLLPAISIRLAERLLFVVITQLGFVISGSLETIAYIDIAVTILLVAAAVLQSVTLLRRFPDFFKIKHSSQVAGMGEKFRAAISRPTVILLIIYSFGMALIQLLPLDELLKQAENVFFGAN